MAERTCIAVDLAKSVLEAVRTVNDLPELLAKERREALEQWGRESRSIIWEAAKALIVVALVAFLLALVAIRRITKQPPTR